VPQRSPIALTCDGGKAQDGLLPRLVQAAAQLGQDFGRRNAGAAGVSQFLLHTRSGGRNNGGAGRQSELIRIPGLRRPLPPSRRILAVLQQRRQACDSHFCRKFHSENVAVPLATTVPTPSSTRCGDALGFSNLVGIGRRQTIT